MKTNEPTQQEVNVKLAELMGLKPHEDLGGGTDIFLQGKDITELYTTKGHKVGNIPVWNPCTDLKQVFECLENMPDDTYFKLDNLVGVDDGSICYRCKIDDWWGGQDPNPATAIALAIFEALQKEGK